jgi:DNA-binding XRE family transcriptional regulator
MRTNDLEGRARPLDNRRPCPDREVEMTGKQWNAVKDRSWLMEEGGGCVVEWTATGAFTLRLCYAGNAIGAIMDDKQAKRLGRFLRSQREAHELSTHELAELCDLSHTTIIRFEQGAYTAPAPDKLARIAEALGVSLADVYALAEYAVPKDLPAPSLYLRTKFRGLSQNELARVTRDVEAVLKRHGINAGDQGAQAERE